MSSPNQVAARDARLQPHDLDRYLAAYHAIQFVLAAPANTFVATAGLTAAAATAGENAQAITHKVSANINDNGWLTGAIGGSLPVNTLLGAVPDDGNGNEIYANLNEAAGVYSFDFFSMVAGVPTAFSLPADTYIIQTPYNHSFETLPFDSLIRSTKHRITQDPAAAPAALPLLEHMTIATLNTIPDLAQVPRAGTYVTMYKNNRTFFSTEPVPIFTVAAAAVTYDQAAAGVDLFPGERVSFSYIV